MHVLSMVLCKDETVASYLYKVQRDTHIHIAKPSITYRAFMQNIRAEDI